jgi:uncharacterized damage-inducible protein DinB
MTNREFFLKTIDAETPIFVKVLKAIPKDKADYKPHERARTTGRIAHQLARQAQMIVGVVKNGAPDFSGYAGQKDPGLDEIVALAEEGYAELKKVLGTADDKDWEESTARLVYPGGKWETKKYDMAWNLLFDAIHHRGQLSTFLRAMGAKVPSIYGGSADEPLASS